ncbi:hypothetical protein [Nocardia amamiensis]|uniref:hypothetical protein n=1 Tax=Nocardia amamiensis TaxID=404578 RepID=UPI00082B249C|nr:hypothetical protein [Nocardia amamiensis]
MARTAKLPPTKKVGIDLSREVVAAIADEAAARGINIRAFYEVALRRELGLPAYPGLPPTYEEGMKLSA